TVALILCVLFGWLGLHRIYVEKLGTGIIEMFTFGGFFVGYILDFIMIAAGTFEDKDGKVVKNWF
ncbi:MAG: TM2 domain-containing protein, partial [Nitrospirae bacterium]